MDRLMRMMYSAAWPLLSLAPRTQAAPGSTLQDPRVSEAKIDDLNKLTLAKAGACA